MPRAGQGHALIERGTTSRECRDIRSVSQRRGLSWHTFFYVHLFICRLTAASERELSQGHYVYPKRSRAYEGSRVPHADMLHAEWESEREAGVEDIAGG